VVADALFDKGAALAARGRPDEARDAYNEVLARFGTYGGPAVLELVGRARRALERL